MVVYSSIILVQVLTLLNLNDIASAQEAQEQTNRPARFSKTGSSLESSTEFLSKTYKSRLAHADKQIGQLDDIISFSNYAYVGNPKGTDDSGAVFFDLRSNVNINNIKRAFVHVYVNANQKTLAGDEFRFSVYQLLQSGKKELLTTHMFDASKSIWHALEIRKAVKAWNKEPLTNYGLFLECKTSSGVKTLSECGIVGFEGKKKYRPFLVAYIDPSNASDLMKQLAPSNAKDMISPDTTKEIFKKFVVDKRKVTTRLCRKRDMEVDFGVLKWNHILQPRKKQIGYCAGNCDHPLSTVVLSTSHGSIQAVLNGINSKKYPKPCCSAGAFESAFFLMYDKNNNLVITDINDLVVTKCACY